MPSLSPVIEPQNAEKIAFPSLYKVVLLNDDTTTMDFVVDVLMKIFNHSFEKANEIMLSVHCNGSGVCGVFALEIALSKQQKVNDASTLAGFELQTRIEPV